MQRVVVLFLEHDVTDLLLLHFEQILIHLLLLLNPFDPRHQMVLRHIGPEQHLVRFFIVSVPHDRIDLDLSLQMRVHFIRYSVLYPSIDRALLVRPHHLQLLDLPVDVSVLILTRFQCCVCIVAYLVSATAYGSVFNGPLGVVLGLQHVVLEVLVVADVAVVPVLARPLHVLLHFPPQSDHVVPVTVHIVQDAAVPCQQVVVHVDLVEEGQ